MSGVSASEFELVIGLEVHAQLRTRSKLFSPASAAYGGEPNTHVNEICAGLPGVLPVLNREAVALAVRAGLALGCEVQLTSRFDRKNYFYPDLPKGYQISQFEQPLCLGGHVDFVVDGEERRCRLTRIHMEEDAGKSIHVRGRRGARAVSHVDLNRAGVPLVEIVGEPELRTPDEAAAYLKALRAVLMYLGVCDGNMEEGSFRCDANVSVRRRGETALGTKVEIKNLNSFKFVRDALAYEQRRQIDCLRSGERIHQETRLWRQGSGRTEGMRRKEGSDDYRYFPDPDLPPLVLDAAEVEGIRASLVELPAPKRARYREALGLSAAAAGVLTASPALAGYFEATVAAGAEPVAAANWIITEVLGALGVDAEVDALPVRPEQLAALLALVADGTITGSIAKRVFALVAEGAGEPAEIVAREGLAAVRDTGELAGIIDDILARHPAEVASYRDGKTKLRGFFVGQVMRATQGKADARLVNELLDERLSG